MEQKPEPKFKVGQIVMIKAGKKYRPFKVLDVIREGDEYFYGWNSRNCAAEHMLRALTDEEKG